MCIRDRLEYYDDGHDDGGWDDFNDLAELGLFYVAGVDYQKIAVDILDGTEVGIGFEGVF